MRLPESFKNTSDKMTLIPSSFSCVVVTVWFYSWDRLIPRGRAAISFSLFYTDSLPSHSSPCVKSLSRVQLFATPWTIAHQAPLSMGFSRHEYWNGLPFPSPGDLPNTGIKPGTPAQPLFPKLESLSRESAFFPRYTSHPSK